MKRIVSILMALSLLLCLAACGTVQESDVSVAASSPPASSAIEPASETPHNTEADIAETEPSMEEPEEESPEEVPAYEPTEDELAERQAIEDALNLQNMDQSWTYNASADAWILSVVVDVLHPVLEDYQGVSVAVPGAYVTGLDTDGDAEADIAAADAGEDAIFGALVIDYDAEIVSTYGQTYTAGTCPVILTTGAAGYGSQSNSTASTTYCAEGYVAVSCGNRGKQSYVTDADGNVDYYTGDAPDCLCDQKAATRFIKYNMLLGNIPGSVDYWVSTGGSGGAAHAAMYAATSNNPDFYDYQIEAGAVGVYRNTDGSYTTSVTIDGQSVEISDGVWGAIPYSAITSLYEGDMAQAFEYYMDTTYSFNTDFQAQLAEYLSQAYTEYINAMGYSVAERDVGFDLDGDGVLNSTIELAIEYDEAKYPDTNGYGGTYLDLYLAEFQSNLQWYLDNLGYAVGWTWFDDDGNALSDSDVAAMTTADKAEAFLEGRYYKAGTNFGGPMGGMGGGMGGPPDMMGGPPDMMGGPPDMMGGPPNLAGLTAGADDAAAEFGEEVRSGGPDAGSTAAAGSGSNSGSYATFDEMAEAYAADIAEIEARDEYGKNIVQLYNPINYIGAEGTDAPAWTRIVMGAVEGDMPMMTSLNMQIKWLSAGTYAQIEWQWDGGHVPNEVLGESLNLYVDEMYGKFVSGVESVKPEAVTVTENGDGTAPSGTDLSGWVTFDEVKGVSFSLADALAYRNSGASKAVPGFDVIDYGQEDYVFGSATQDARHWNPNLLVIFQNDEYASVLRSLF